MDTNEIETIANTVPNLATLRIYLHLINLPKYDGGVYTTKFAMCEELQISNPIVYSAFKWLKEKNYIIETKVKGQTKFLINDRPGETITTQKVDTSAENKQTTSVIRKGGKTITRMEIPDFWK